MLYVHVVELALVIFLGSFAGFDETCPTSRSGGKPKVAALLKEKFGFKKLVAHDLLLLLFLSLLKVLGYLLKIV